MTKKNDLNNSRLFDLIAHLDRREFVELGKWLRSPFHNTSEKVIKLYEGIKTKHRNTGRPVNELTLLKYIGLIPSVKQKNVEPQHRKELKDVMHKMTFQIQDYMVWKKVKKDSVFARQQLIEALMERGMHRHMLPLITKSEKELQATPYQDIVYCEQAFKLEEMRFGLHIILNSLDIKKIETSLLTLINTLEDYSLSNLLKFYCSAISYERILNVRQNYPLRSTIQEYLENHDNKQPSVGIYHRMLQLLINKKEETYYGFKDFLFQHLDVFDIGEVRQFFNCALNYCTQMIKQGNKTFIKEKFMLYEKGLELGCWSQNGYFPQNQYIKIIQNALLLHKVYWANNFIDQYTNLLKEETKNLVIDYCNALVYHHNKQHEKAMYHLPTDKLPPDFSYYLHIKILKVKIHYDSNDWGFLPDGGYAILNELENMRQYVNRPSREIAQNIREQYINFKNIFTAIFNRKRKIMYPDDTPPVTQAKLESLRTKLNKTSPIVERTWLEEKIKELMQEIS